MFYAQRTRNSEIWCKVEKAMEYVERVETEVCLWSSVIYAIFYNIYN